MKKRKLLVIAICTVLLAAMSILGTVAYLTDASEVVNTFTVGKVLIRLDEAVVDENGAAVGDRTEVGNVYHLLPGAVYVKDPTLTVLKGSEEAYVRMLVTFNSYEELKAIFGGTFTLDSFTEGRNESFWPLSEVTEDGAANTVTFEFRYFETVKPSEGKDLPLDALFDTITVPDAVTGEQLRTLADLEIVIEAHAIQAIGFADADAAWEAFSK